MSIYSTHKRMGLWLRGADGTYSTTSTSLTNYWQLLGIVDYYCQFDTVVTGRPVGHHLDSP